MMNTLQFTRPTELSWRTKSNEPLQTFNPFSVSSTGAEWDRVVFDPYLPPPRGFTLFRLGF